MIVVRKRGDRGRFDFGWLGTPSPAEALLFDLA